MQLFTARHGDKTEVMSALGQRLLMPHASRGPAVAIRGKVLRGQASLFGSQQGPWGTEQSLPGPKQAPGKYMLNER